MVYHKWYHLYVESKYKSNLEKQSKKVVADGWGMGEIERC